MEKYESLLYSLAAKSSHGSTSITRAWQVCEGRHVIAFRDPGGHRRGVLHTSWKLRLRQEAETNLVKAAVINFGPFCKGGSKSEDRRLEMGPVVK